MENLKDSNVDGETIKVTEQVIGSVPPLSTNILLDFYKDGVEITDKQIDELETDNHVLPVADEATINKFLTELQDNKKLEDLDGVTKRTIKTIIGSTDLSNLHEVGCDDKISNMDNCLHVDGKELRLKNISVRNNSKNFNTAKIKLGEKLNIGVPTHVPLYHSGFWVTLSPLSTKIEKINLQLEIAQEVDRIGKMTHNLVYSNYSVLFASTLVDTLRNHITDTSITLEDGDDIFDYIKVQDLDMLIWGLLKTMYPRGFDYVVLCKNAVQPGEDNVPKCNFKLNVKLELHKMLKVDNDRFNIEHKQQMLKRSSKSVTKDEVTNYQDTLEANQEETINIQLEDYLVTLNIKSPNITRYLENGHYFIDTVTDKLNKLIADNILKDDNDKAKANAERLITNSILVTIYNHYISSVNLNGVLKDEYDEVYDILELLSAEDEYRNKVISKIVSYIDNSLVSVIGVPNYVCPECKTSQVESESNFRSFIGLDVYNYFFTLLAFQYQKATTGLLLK